MSATASFTADLVRAAEAPAALSGDERRRLVGRAVKMVREMRITAGMQSNLGTQDPLRFIKLTALLAEASGSDGNVKEIMLDLADTIRTLEMVLDPKD